jgi:hypothetical protein
LLDRTYAFGACGLRTNQTEARFEGLEIIDSRVFVVHGHDEGARESIARLLERQEVAGSQGPACG